MRENGFNIAVRSIPGKNKPFMRALRREMVSFTTEKTLPGSPNMNSSLGKK